MANFTGERVPIDTSMTDYNLGYDQSGEIMGRAMGNAMGTMASAISAATSQYEDYKKKQEEAEEDAMMAVVNSEADKLFEEQLSSYGLSTGGTGQDAESAAISEGGSALSKLNSARQQGRVNPMMFKMKSYGLLKRMRQQYPHKREEIDKMVQQALGFRPANALLSELESQAAAEQGEASKDRRDAISFLQTAAGSVGLGPFAGVNFFEADEQTLNAAVNYAQRSMTTKSELNRIESEFDFTTKLSKEQTKERNQLIGDYYMNDSRTLISRVLQQSGVKNGREAEALQTRDPEQARAIAQELQKQRDLYVANMQRSFARDVNVDQATIDVQTKAAVGPIDAMISALADGTNLARTTDEAFALSTLQTRNKWNAELELGNTGALIERLGFDNFMAVMEKYPVESENALSFLAEANIGAVMADKFNKNRGYAGFQNNQDPASARRTIGMVADIASLAPNIENKEVIQRIFSEYYNSGKLDDTFAGKSAVEVYRTLIQPGVIDAVNATGDPKLQGKLREFILENWQKNQGLRELGGNVGEAVAQLDGIASVEMQPDGTLRPVLDMDKWESFIGQHDQGTKARYLNSLRGIQESVNELNAVTKNVGYYLQTQGTDVGQGVQELLQIAGAGGGSKGFYNWLMDAMVSNPVVESAMTATSAVTGMRLYDFATVIRREEEILKGFVPKGVDRQTTGGIPTRGGAQLESNLGRLGAVQDGYSTGKAIVDKIGEKYGRGVGLAMTSNFMGETGDFKYLQEIEPMVKGSRGGVGLIQWTGPRRRQFEAWVEQNGKDINSIEHNLEYVFEEARGLHGNHWTKGYSWDEFVEIANQDPDAGMVYFQDGFLRPGKPHTEGRRQRLQKLMA